MINYCAGCENEITDKDDYDYIIENGTEKVLCIDCFKQFEWSRYLSK